MNDELTQEKILGQVRTIIAMVGGGLVAQGVITNSTWTWVSGALGGIVGLGMMWWSARSKDKNEAATKAREAIAVNKGLVIADAHTGPTPSIPNAAVPAVLAAVPLPAPTPPPTPAPAEIAAIIKAAAPGPGIAAQPVASAVQSTNEVKP